VVFSVLPADGNLMNARQPAIAIRRDTLQNKGLTMVLRDLCIQVTEAYYRQEKTISAELIYNCDQIEISE